MKYTPLIIIAAVILFVGSLCVYTVDETEQVVITQFGKPIGAPITESGLHFKVPYYTVNRFPKNLLEWDGDPDQIPTLDKTFIWVDTFARWKIVDPLKYFETLNNEMAAQASLDDILNSAIRNAITSYPLIETVRNTNRKLEVDNFDSGVNGNKKDDVIGKTVKVGRAKIAMSILNAAQPKLADFGIQLIDVKIKRLNYEKEVQKSVFDRMIAERNQKAEKFRSEGKGEASKIQGDLEKEKKRIESEAYEKAQEIKGKADAQATLIYAQSYGKDPEFYSFTQTLELYKHSLGKDNSLILSTDSEFLKYFKGYKGKE